MSVRFVQHMFAIGEILVDKVHQLSSLRVPTFWPGYTQLCQTFQACLPSCPDDLTAQLVLDQLVASLPKCVVERIDVQNANNAKHANNDQYGQYGQNCMFAVRAGNTACRILLPDNTIWADDQTFLVFDAVGGLVKQACLHQVNQSDQSDPSGYKCVADVYRTRIQPDTNQAVQYWYRNNWLVVSGELGTSVLNLVTFQLSKKLDFVTQQVRLLGDVWLACFDQTCCIVDSRCEKVVHTFQMAANSRLDQLLVQTTSRHVIVHDKLDTLLAVHVVNHDSHLSKVHYVQESACSIVVSDQRVRVVMPTEILTIELE